MFISTVLIVLKKHYRFDLYLRWTNFRAKFRIFSWLKFSQANSKICARDMPMIEVWWTFDHLNLMSRRHRISKFLGDLWLESYIKMVLNKPLSRPPYTCYSYITHRDNICSTIHIIHFDQPQISSFELLMLTLGCTFSCIFHVFFCIGGSEKIGLVWTTIIRSNNQLDLM